MAEQFLNNAAIFLVTAAVIASVFPFFLIVMVIATGAFILFYRLSQNGIQSLKRYLKVIIVLIGFLIKKNQNNSWLNDYL